MLSRFSPKDLGRGFTAQNRVVLPPMASGTAGEDGVATAATLAHYRRLAEAGTGIAFVEYSFVDASGRSEPNQLGAATAAQGRALAPLAAALKAHGAVAGLQLTHAGGKTERQYSGGVLMAPRAIAVPVKDRTLEIPTPMTPADVRLWREAFHAAAARGAEAGFDLIELHAAHGYGLSQWLSPLTHPVPLAGRAELLLAVVADLRRLLPDKLLAVRLGGADFLPGGNTPVETAQIARWLEAAGVDLIDVSSGVGGWRRPDTRQGEGYLVPEAAAIQAAVAIPVIGVGGIESGAYIDAALNDGLFAFAAAGRAILKDPSAFRATVLTPPAASRTPADSPRSTA